MRAQTESGTRATEALAPEPTAGSFFGNRTVGSAPARGTGASATTGFGAGLGAVVVRDGFGRPVVVVGAGFVVEVLVVVGGAVLVVLLVAVEEATEVGAAESPGSPAQATRARHTRETRGTAYTGRVVIG